MVPFCEVPFSKKNAPCLGGKYHFRTIYICGGTEKRRRISPSPLRVFPVFRWLFLLEITIEETLQGLAVPCLVARHFMDGVVDGVQAVLLRAGGQVELALPHLLRKCV